MTFFLSTEDFVYDASTLDTAFQMTSVPDGSDWFFPMAYLESLVGRDSPVFQFWCKTCATVWQPSLFNKTNLCNRGAPIYPCAVQSLSVLSSEICSFGYQWLASAFFSETCDVPEAPCVNF